MRLRLAAACAAALLAGCDAATPEFDPTNPYDPLFEGQRIVTAPADLAYVTSDGTSLTIRWTDRSSFETGYRIDRATSLTGTFSMLSRVGADVTTFTETGIVDSQERQYRVVGVADGETSSAPSDTLRLRRRIVTQPLQGIGPNATRALFTADGTVAYSLGTTGVYVSDTESGERLGTFQGVSALVGTVAGNRLVAVQASAPAEIGLGVYDGPTLARTLALTAGGTGCPQITAATLVVSADGQTFAAACGTDSRTVAVWGSGGGAPARLVTVPGLRAVLLALAPDGRRLAVSALSTTGGRTVTAADATTGAALWTVTDVRPPDNLLLFSPDGTRLLDAASSPLRLRDAATGAVVAQQSDPPDRVVAASFSPDGAAVAVTTTLNASVSVLRASDLALVFRVRDTRATATRLLDGNAIIGFRGTTTGAALYDIARWDPRAPWEVVAGGD